MHSSRALKTVIFSLAAIILSSKVMPDEGTFVSIPSGQHINHMFIGHEKVFFASEDGVLIYDHLKARWQNAVTATEGLTQYPALIVWQDEINQDISIVTPDYLFRYNEQTRWMRRENLPLDLRFQGKYALGVLPNELIVSATASNSDSIYAAVYSRSSGTFEKWGNIASLNLALEDIDWVEHIESEIDQMMQDLPGRTIPGGYFDADGQLHLDKQHIREYVSVSSLASTTSGETFLATYGLGAFYSPMQGIDFEALPFGLLSPDVMTLGKSENELLVGSRTGVTRFDSSQTRFRYYRAHDEISWDLEYVSALVHTGDAIFVAARGGVFKQMESSSGWIKVISSEVMHSKRIYALAFKEGTLAVATEANVFIKGRNSNFTTLFQENAKFPVFDIVFSDNFLWGCSYFGLFQYNSDRGTIDHIINSFGLEKEFDSNFTIDPVYEFAQDSVIMCATTSRGLLLKYKADVDWSTVLSPTDDFRPRGLALAGGRIWVGTEQGLWTYTPDSNSWKHYTTADGLISNFITDIIESWNYIWIGTDYGITRINWQRLK